VKEVPTITIMKHCSHDGCRKVAVVAEKVADFWVTKCLEHHHSGEVTLGKDSLARMEKVYSVVRRVA
jgi:hypothetical protein